MMLVGATALIAESRQSILGFQVTSCKFDQPPTAAGARQAGKAMQAAGCAAMCQNHAVAGCPAASSLLGGSASGFTPAQWQGMYMAEITALGLVGGTHQQYPQQCSSKAWCKGRAGAAVMQGLLMIACQPAGASFVSSRLRHES